MDYYSLDTVVLNRDLHGHGLKIGDLDGTTGSRHEFDLKAIRLIMAILSARRSSLAPRG